MKPVCLLISLLSPLFIIAQDFEGKWYGKLTQGPGGFRDTYEFELDLKTKEGVSGVSYAYIPNLIDAKIGFNGYIEGDTIRIQERANLIEEENTPTDWIICIKTLSLGHLKLANKDYLRGRWTGVNKQDGSPCVSGLIILARDRKDLKQFIAPKGATTITLKRPIISTGPYATDFNSGPLPAFAGDFKNSSVHKLTEIEVDNSDLYIILTDYDKIDDDTVSVYLNREALVEKVKIDDNSFIVRFSIDEAAANELLLFAENQGKIPPNTVKMVLIDGKMSHRILIDSDKYRSAAVYLKRRATAPSDSGKTKSPLELSKGPTN